MGDAEVAEGRQQQGGDHVVPTGDGHDPGQPLVLAHRNTLHLGELHRDPLHHRHHLPTGCGQDVAVLAAIKKPRTKMYLQRLHPPGHGGVAHAQDFPGGAHRAQPGESQEKLCVVPVHSVA